MLSATHVQYEKYNFRISSLKIIRFQYTRRNVRELKYAMDEDKVFKLILTEDVRKLIIPEIKKIKNLIKEEKVGRLSACELPKSSDMRINSTNWFTFSLSGRQIQ